MHTRHKGVDITASCRLVLDLYILFSLSPLLDSSGKPYINISCCNCLVLVVPFSLLSFLRGYTFIFIYVQQMPSYTDELARFLATTGPPVQSPMLSSPSRHRQLLSRLRTPGNKRKQVSPLTEASSKHIPLPVYYDPTVPLSVPPKSPLPQTPVEPRRRSCPERTNRYYNSVDIQERKDVEQVKTLASDNNNNITKNPSLSSSLAHIAFPKPPNTMPCPFCARLRTTDSDQAMEPEISSSQEATPTKRKRRLSCPAAIKYKPQTPPIQQNLSSQEAKALFGLIEQLQSQLVQEQASRKALEEVLVMTRRSSTTTNMMPFPP